MGICLSKKTREKEEHGSGTAAIGDQPRSSKPFPSRANGAATATPSRAAASPKRKQIFVAVPGSDRKPPLEPQDKDAAPGIAPPASSEKKPEQTPPSSESELPVAPAVRTSSCTKEEVESILIQCGRLSRNSSAVEDEFRRSRKRSFDFDCGDRAAEEDKDKPHLNKASPRRHRRTPSRDRDGESSEEPKRSVSRGRRVSRSPARRSESPATARPNPGKLIVVPPREKQSLGSKAAPPFSAADGGSKLRSASPRSRSPAHNCSRAGNENAPSLSRSSSRKAEQSPHRRNPMAEVDGNCLVRAEQQPSSFHPQKRNSTAAELTDATNCGSRCSKAKDEAEEMMIRDRVKAVLSRSRSSRRGSRDLDAAADLALPSSYASLLLEDIQNYHQQAAAVVGGPPPVLDLPACVAKANAIIEAVAELKSAAARKPAKTAQEEPLSMPSLPRRVESEPQESAGSNSVVAGQQTWASSSSSPREPGTGSVESADRSCTSSRLMSAGQKPKQQRHHHKRKQIGINVV